MAPALTHKYYLPMLIRSITIGLVAAAGALPLAVQASNVSASLTGNADVRAVLQDVVVSSPAVEGSTTASATVSAQVGGSETPAITSSEKPLVMSRDDLRVTTTASAEEDGSLAAHVRARLAADTHIDSVALSSKQVSLTYRVPAKLFGFIRVETPLRITVSASGATTVSYPWYGFLLTGNQAGVTLRAQSAAQSVLATPTISDAISAQTQATLFDSLTTALEATGDTTP